MIPCCVWRISLSTFVPLPVSNYCEDRKSEMKCTDLIETKKRRPNKARIPLFQTKCHGSSPLLGWPNGQMLHVDYSVRYSNNTAISSINPARKMQRLKIIREAVPSERTAAM